MRYMLFVLAAVFLCHSAVMVFIAPHAALVIMEETPEVSSGFEEAWLSGHAGSPRRFPCDGHIFRHLLAYQNPSLDTLKQPPRHTV